jgi:hypothetical protein
MDHANNDKRYKKDQNSDILDHIYHALKNEEDTKKIKFQKNLFGEPYLTNHDESSDLWFLAQSEDTQLLVLINSITLEDGSLVIRRIKKKKPSDPGLHLENMIHVAIWTTFKEYFEDDFGLEVETKFTESGEIISCKKPSKDDLVTSIDYFEIFRQQAEGEIHLVIDTDKCPYCWFKTCPSRKLPTDGFKTGKPLTWFM